jgi:serine/threonine protein kinase
MTGRIETIFEQALALPPGARGEFLAQVRQTDPGVADEVDSLLAYDGGAAQNLSLLVGAAITGAAAEETAEEQGRSIGSYRIVRHIASGGMGSVYEVCRAGDYRRRAALKLSRISSVTPRTLKILERERQILADLDHPGIARLFDGGTTPDGRPYLVMEYVDGAPITEYVCTGGMAIRERVVLFRKVCAAVEYAHQRLVVHRDLKPDHILVTADGEPHVIDFGIAKLLPSEGPETFGNATIPFLSPAYCSPEQARGESVTTLSDVYSLGIVLFEVLTGRSASETGPGAAPALEARPLVAAELDRDLASIIQTATRFEPAERYDSVSRLNDDLGRYLAGRPISAHPATVRYRVSKFIKRRRPLVLSSIVAILALAVGATAFVWQARRAERRFTQARHLANALLADVHDRMNVFPGAVAMRSRVSETAIQYLNGLAAEVGSDPDLRLELASAYAGLAAAQGGVASQMSSANATASAERGLALIERLPGVYADRARRIEADLLLQRGQALADSGRVTHAIADLQRCADLSRCDAKSELECERELAARYHLSYHASATRQFTRSGENLSRMESILSASGAAWPDKKRLWELYVAGRQMRLILQRDKNPQAAARVGDALVASAEKLATERSDGPTLNALLRFFNYYSSALTMNKATPLSRNAPPAHQSWQIAQRLHDLDPSDVRNHYQLALAADRLGWVYQASDPVRCAEWFEKSLAMQIEARVRAGASKDRDDAAKEAAMEAIRCRLRARQRSLALESAAKVSAAMDLMEDSGLQIPRSGEARRLQAYWFAARASEGLPEVASPELLWTDARRQAEAALSDGSGDPAVVVAAAAIFDRWPATVVRNDEPARRAEQLWRIAATALPGQKWIQERLASHAARAARH